MTLGANAEIPSSSDDKSVYGIRIYIHTYREWEMCSTWRNFSKQTYIHLRATTISENNLGFIQNSSFGNVQSTLYNACKQHLCQTDDVDEFQMNAGEEIISKSGYCKTYKWHAVRNMQYGGYTPLDDT